VKLEITNICCESNNDEGLKSLFFEYIGGYFTIAGTDDDNNIYIEKDDQSNGQYFDPDYFEYSFINGEIKLYMNLDDKKTLQYLKNNNLNANLYGSIILTFAPVSLAEFDEMNKIIKWLFKKSKTNEIDISKEWNLSSFTISKEGGFLYTKKLLGYDVNGGVDYNQKKNELEKVIALGKRVFDNIDELDKNAKKIIREEEYLDNVAELKLDNITFSGFKHFSLIYKTEQGSIIVQFKHNFTLEQILEI